MAFQKLQQVTELLGTLEKDLENRSLSSSQKVQFLLQLRQHGTSPDNAGPIYSNRGMEVIGKYAVDGESPDVRRAALRCIANALLLDPNMRKTFAETGYGGKLAELLRSDSSEDEMAISRILFLSTYDPTMDFKKLIDEHSLADNVIHQLRRHLAQFSESGEGSLTQIDELGLTDTSKVIFNISKLHPDLASFFSPAIPLILNLICRIQIPSQPLDGLLDSLLSSLTVLDLENKKGTSYESNPLFPPSDENRNINKLIEILDRYVSSFTPQDLDVKGVTLIDTLVTLYELAPEDSQKHMKSLLLPGDSDRSQPIGQSDTLSSKLLKLSTAPFSFIKNAVSELLLVLSGKDAEQLTRNIGYGYASGILASRGIQLPQTAGEAVSTEHDRDVNPITGQRWDAERQDTGPPMTDEEKEREAERLFVLFERARANGILNVENPVAQALREGRLEELPESDGDSD
ncbi:guanine nucleotide exchange factor [Aspergillus ambiguus]|uniref:synembryn n=1 Tax=Aspergillus ambiguus TaxID=176160 RepID=UPI003CCE1CFC